VITRRGLLWSLPLVALSAKSLLSRALSQPTPRGVLFVYNAVSGDASLVRDLGSPNAILVELPALKLGRWNVRIGVLDDYLLTLDTESHRVHAISLDWVRKQASGVGPGTSELPPEALHTSALRAGVVPYRAVIHRDRIIVDYFSANRLEIYRWQRATAALEYLDEHVLASDKPLGLSDLAIQGDQLWVAASGISCLKRICPKESKPDPHVFSFRLEPEPLGKRVVDVRPSNANAAGLYLHPATGAVYVLNAGDYRAGYSSIQRIQSNGKLSREIRLARNAGAARAYALDARTFLILQFSGEHVFVFDAVEDRVLATLRFDGQSFVPIKADAPLSERFKSDLQDVLPDAAGTERFLIVDSKREQLLHVAFQPPSRLELLNVTSLRTTAFRASPSWSVWLRL
jgi:hypothetical protein